MNQPFQDNGGSFAMNKPIRHTHFFTIDDRRYIIRVYRDGNYIAKVTTSWYSL